MMTYQHTLRIELTQMTQNQLVQFDLRDCIDFRPTVANVTGATDSVTTIDTITGNSFDFSARVIFWNWFWCNKFTKTK